MHPDLKDPEVLASLPPEVRAQEELARGRRAAAAFEEFIGPFCQEKKQVLWEAFQSPEELSPDLLMELRRTLQVLNQLEIELQDFVMTGRMAAKELEEMKDGN